jgi:hypothetical protein
MVEVTPIISMEVTLADIRSRIEHAEFTIKRNDASSKELKEVLIPELQKSEAEYVAALDKLMETKGE